ncbi:MAG: ATP-binding cassette domain-containing protein [Deltaproteobacteria bacterium]|jgi:tungstate transport system ATP-binding protein|nr:ATP-binding cassette domain-containing protein [Deltaproteobacteria bacterium]
MDRLFQLKDITVSLGERFTLNVHNLELRPEKIYVFTGPNGAGKSTLLKVLSFLLLPSSGQLWFQEQQVTSESNIRNRLRRLVTLVEQSPYLFSGSVYHNLAFGLRIRGIRGAEQKRRIIRALQMVGMNRYLKCNVRELSGGEAQRVALARALALEPEVLILDEPAANIDRDSLEMIEAILRQLPGKGVTVIMSTHDSQQPERVGGQVIALKDGLLRMDQSFSKNSI